MLFSAFDLLFHRRPQRSAGDSQESSAGIRMEVRVRGFWAVPKLMVCTLEKKSCEQEAEGSSAGQKEGGAQGRLDAAELRGPEPE